MKVKFLPQDVEFEIQPGQTVMGLAHEKGIPIRSTCNGLPSCAECRIKVTDGDWNTNPPARKELGLIGTGYYIDQRRLSCQLLCFGDITIDTSEQLEKAAEGPVTKKFLTKVHKTSVQESHSLGGVLIEESGNLIHELKKDVPASTASAVTSDANAGFSAGGRGRRERGGGGGGGGAQSRGGAPQGGGGQGGGGKRRRRGGRGRSRGGGGGGAPKA